MNLLVTAAFDELARLTASFEFGLLRALDETRDALRRTLPGFAPATHEVSEWLAAGGVFRYQGSNHDLWPYAEPFLMPLVDLIQSKVQGLWTEAGRFEGVLLTGGGAAILGKYLRPRLRNYANVTLPPNPRWANAQGYLRLARRQWPES